MRKSGIWKIEKSVLELLIVESKTYGDIIAKLHEIECFCNRRTLQKRMAEEGFEYEKFQKHSGTTIGIERLDSETFIENSTVCRSVVRRKILKRNLLKYTCAICELKPQWCDKKLSLILDHINGKNNDHRLENLRWLCPNCNSQTDTFCSRNRLGQDKPKTSELCICGKRKNRKSITCINCLLDSRRGKSLNLSHPKKFIRPSKEEFEKMIWLMPLTKLAARFGASDNALRKWAKDYKLLLPPQGYWLRKKK